MQTIERNITDVLMDFIHDYTSRNQYISLSKTDSTLMKRQNKQ